MAGPRAKQKGSQRSHATGPEWWTGTKPIRTVAEQPMSFALHETRPPFADHYLTERASELWRLGMSATAIARALAVSDKTVAKALRYRVNAGPTGYERSDVRFRG